MKIIWKKEVLEELQNELYKALLEKDIENLLQKRPMLKQELKELELLESIWKKENGKVVQIKVGNKIIYMVWQNNFEIIKLEFLIEKENLREVKINYYEDTPINEYMVHLLKRESELKIKLRNPSITIIEKSQGYSYLLGKHLALKTRTEKRRFQENNIKTKEIYEKLKLTKKAFYLEKISGEENIVQKERTLKVSRNHFNKMYQNALALTKEKKVIK